VSTGEAKCEHEPLVLSGEEKPTLSSGFCTRLRTGDEMAQLSIKQVRSAIGRRIDQKRTLVALGITRMGGEVLHTDTPQIRGMINKISHLLEVKEVKE